MTVFIVGLHKSGTSLLRALLDNHPDLAVLPREPHFIERVGLGVNYPVRRTSPGEVSTAATLQRTVAALHVELVDDNPYSDSPTFRGYDPEAFRAAWAPASNSLGDQYVAYVSALRTANGDTPPHHGRVVDKSTEYLEHVPVLAHFVPDSQFLHIMRDPSANLVAWRRYRQKASGSFPALRGMVSALAHQPVHAKAYELLYGPARYLAVTYEDLVVNPAEVMKMISRFLSLPWHPHLLRPTSGGVAWGGNSVSGKNFTGVSVGPTQEWRSHLTSLEVACLQRLNAVDGKPVDSPSRARVLRPLPGERLSTWLANRTLAFAG